MNEVIPNLPASRVGNREFSGLYFSRLRNAQRAQFDAFMQELTVDFRSGGADEAAENVGGTAIECLVDLLVMIKKHPTFSALFDHLFVLFEGRGLIYAFDIRQRKKLIWAFHQSCVALLEGMFSAYKPREWFIFTSFIGRMIRCEISEFLRFMTDVSPIDGLDLLVEHDVVRECSLCALVRKHKKEVSQ